MDNTDSQNKQILGHLKAGNSITPLEALNIFGCFRLGARIYDLRRQGVEILDWFITLPNGKRVKEYSLKK